MAPLNVLFNESVHVDLKKKLLMNLIFSSVIVAITVGMNLKCFLRLKF